MRLVLDLATELKLKALKIVTDEQKKLDVAQIEMIESLNQIEPI
jgi:hypothetical protein